MLRLKELTVRIYLFLALKLLTQRIVTTDSDLMVSQTRVWGLTIATRPFSRLVLGLVAAVIA